MFYLLKVLIERQIHTLDRPFSYACLTELNPKKGERVIVSFNKKQTIGFIIDDPELIQQDIKEFNKGKTFETLFIDKLIDNSPVLTDEMFELADKVAKYYHSTLISIYKTMLPPSLKPASSFKNKPKEAFVKMITFKKDDDGSLSKLELKALNKIKEKGSVKFTGFGMKKTVAVLLAKGFIEIVDVKVNRLAEYEKKEYVEKKLSEEQLNAYNTIVSKDKKVFLLEGVTGSGKTEVFFKLTEYYRSIGKGVLILEPEIALTSRLVTIFKSKFKDDVAVIHSGETAANLYDEHLRIASGKANIVIGARSAIFAPVNNLGLIILDEEHVGSYKQENEPYFHARTVAIMRSEMLGAKLVLASATPSLETKARAEKKVYEQLYLTKRFTGYALPKVEIIDMANIKNLDTDSIIISIPLRKAIAETIAKNKQAILFINRRGYAPVYSCRKCGKIFKCPNCDVPLTYHKEDNKIKCHHCDYELSAADLKCENCGSEVFSNTGFGTERIVDEVRRLFPMARIARLDSDIASRKKEFNMTLFGFENHDYDILIGTQMIAKGHDFKDVELAVSLMADKSLSIPNYKANEDTFDLLTQLIGRAGRFSNNGKAIIQTYMPENEIINLSANQGYEQFYKFEMHNRKVFQYPPYTFLAIITISGTDSDELETFCYKVKGYLTAELKNARVNIYGPSFPYIKKVNNRYYRKLMLKYKSRQEVEQVFNNLFNLEGKDIKISLDIDPVSDC